MNDFINFIKALLKQSTKRYKCIEDNDYMCLDLLVLSVPLLSVFPLHKHPQTSPKKISIQ